MSKSISACLRFLTMMVFTMTTGATLWSQGFVTTFGGPYIQTGCGVAELSNGEIVVVGEEVWDPTVTDFELVWFRLSPTGEVLSKKRDLWVGNTSPEKMIALNDNRFIVVGSNEAWWDRGPSHPYISERDADGEVVWQTTLTQISGDSSVNSLGGGATDVDTVPGGGFLLTCHAAHLAPTFQRLAYLVKLDDLGRVSWIKADSGLGFGVQGQSVIDAEGNIYTALNTRTSFQDTSKIAITKRNSQGELLWRKVLGNDGNFEFMYVVDMELNRSGEIVMGGTCSQETQEYHGMLLKVSPEGEKIKEQIFEIDGWPGTIIRNILISESDDVVAVGGVERPGDRQSPYGYYDALVVEASASLDIKKSILHNATPSSFDQFSTLIPTADGHGFILTGWASNLPNNVDNEILLAKINCHGDTLDPDIPGQPIDLLAYPVPSSGMVSLSAESEAFCLDRLRDLEVEVYNTLGQKLVVAWDFRGGELVLDFTNRAPGNYFVTFKSTMGALRTEKILISR